MAGDIWINKQARWPVNSSLYHWVLDFLIANVDDPDTVANLEVIDDNNLGIVDVEDYPPAVQEQIIALLRDRLVPDAEVRVAEMDRREKYIDALRGLARLAESVQTPVSPGND